MLDELIFSEWLVQQMGLLDLTITEFAKRAGISRAVIHKTIKQLNKQPSAETCRGIARALSISQLIVFRRAGLITEPVDAPELSPVAAEVVAIFDQLSPSAQSETLEHIRIKQKYDKK